MKFQQSQRNRELNFLCSQKALIAPKTVLVSDIYIYSLKQIREKNYNKKFVLMASCRYPHSVCVCMGHDKDLPGRHAVSFSCCCSCISQSLGSWNHVFDVCVYIRSLALDAMCTSDTLLISFD